MTRPRVHKALIPAAGRGTRFLPLTKAVPKELAPIVTTPALQFVVEEAAGAGVTDVLLVVSAGKTGINEYFSPQEELEAALEAKGDESGLELIRTPVELVRYDYVEQKEPRGLGDAVAHGEQFAAGEPLAVLLPDDLIDDRDALLGPMLDVYAEYGGVVLGLLDVGRDEISRYGCVVLEDGADAGADVVPIVDLVEKPKPEDAPSTLAIIGRYVLPPEIFDALRHTTPGSGGEIQLTDAMARLIGKQPFHALKVNAVRHDCGDTAGFVIANLALGLERDDVGPKVREFIAGL
jgi:UTP--glucose-1-phosphate uridylyltransferase